MRRRTIWLIALAWLSGCSVQMAYDNLDRLARWGVSDYVNLDDAQRAYFEQQFALLWDWHRRDHLPRYADFLDAVALRMDDRATAEELDAMIDRIAAWADEIEGRALPVAANLLASLTDEQVDQLARAMEESNQELAEPELDVPPEQARMQWREEFADRFSDFSGRLNALQLGYLDDQSRNYQPERLLWVDYRRRWQRDLLALLVFRRDVQGLERSLAQLSAHRELYHGRELATVYEHNNRLAGEVSVWLINSLTGRQRRRFAERLQDLSNDFRELAADTRPRADRRAPLCLVGC